MEITANILAFKDSDGSPLVEKIRDAAGQVLVDKFGCKKFSVVKLLTRDLKCLTTICNRQELNALPLSERVETLE